MHIALLDVVVFTIYMLGVLVLGMYAARRSVATKRDYFLAGDKLPWWMVGGSIIAANISSHHFVGIMGVAYDRGFVAMNIAWLAIFLGFNALLWIFLPFYIRNGFYTMPEFLDRRFGGAARTLYGGLILITYMFVEISAVLYLGSVVLESLFQMPPWLSITGLAVVTGVYAIAGGLRAVVWTEMLQLGVLITGGAMLSILTIHKVGGVGAALATSGNWRLMLPATDVDFPWTQLLGGLLCISVFYNAANQFIVQRTLAAKNEWHARMGVVFTDYLQFVTPFIYIVPGVLAPLLFPHLERGDLAFPTLVQNILPHGAIGVVMAGLIAAVMSHISGAVNACTTIVTVDFYLPYINQRATDAQAVRFGKWAGVVVIIVGIFWAQFLRSHADRPIFLYLLNAYGYFTPGIASMFLLGIFWKRTTHAGALVAGGATIPLSVFLEQWTKTMSHPWAEYLHPFLNRTGIVFWVCMILGVAVSLCTKPAPAKQIERLIWNVKSLKLPPEQRSAIRGLRRPGLWWALITAVTLYMYIRFR